MVLKTKGSKRRGKKPPKPDMGIGDVRVPESVFHADGDGQVERSVCRRLRALAAGVPADQAIIEIGAYRGRSTGYLVLGAQEGNRAHVTTIDPWTLRPLSSWPEGYFDVDVIGKYSEKESYDAFKAHMERIGATRDMFTVKRGYGANAAAKWEGPKVGLLWHDAEHTADAVETDLAAWLPHLADTATVVLHDAGNPHFGVVEGAGRVLDVDGWDWEGREVARWHVKSEKRGALYVRRPT